jgi:hypothetical protein
MEADPWNPKMFEQRPSQGTTKSEDQVRVAQARGANPGIPFLDRAGPAIFRNLAAAFEINTVLLTDDLAGQNKAVNSMPASNFDAGQKILRSMSSEASVLLIKILANNGFERPKNTYSAISENFGNVIGPAYHQRLRKKKPAPVFLTMSNVIYDITVLLASLDPGNSHDL